MLNDHSETTTEWFGVFYVPVLINVCNLICTPKGELNKLLLITSSNRNDPIIDACRILER